jgi:hypothetical protein
LLPLSFVSLKVRNVGYFFRRPPETCGEGHQLRACASRCRQSQCQKNWLLVLRAGRHRCFSKTSKLIGANFVTSWDRADSSSSGRPVRLEALSSSSLCCFGRSFSALADISKNSVADLVRDLRSSDWPVPERFATSVVVLGDFCFIRFARRHEADVILNFAASTTSAPSGMRSVWYT